MINGEPVSGVTTMQMDEGLDTGDMIMKTEIVLDEKETGGSLHDKLAEAGAKLCVETLKAVEDGTAVRTKQGETGTDYAKQLNKKMGDIDWTKPAVEIERLIRGLNPWPSAYTSWSDKTMKIWEAEVLDKEMCIRDRFKGKHEVASICLDAMDVLVEESIRRSGAEYVE